MEILVNENKTTEASVLLERARVLSNMLLNSYFNQEIEIPKDFWKLSGNYYDNARVVLEIILCSVCDAEALIADAIVEGTVVRGIVVDG